jgi:lipid-A-disaccharide synthase
VTGQQPRKILDKPLDVFIVAGESSADDLGARFMRALAALRPTSFRGVGGARMSAAGLASLYPAQGLFSIGIGTVIAKLPLLLRRMRETADAIVAAPPDVLVLIDAPDFTHRIARRVRRRLPHLPIVKYVSPSVWVWRPGRARAMRPSIDLVLALLPFEPEVHRQLGGPECVYVGHSLLDHLSDLRPSADEERQRAGSPPLVLALPGSRRHEVERLAMIFGEALGLVAAKSGPLEVVLPTVPHLVARLSELTSRWPVRPRIVVDEAEKHRAFRRARAALAASGTVTLELALAHVPTVAAYRIPAWEGMVFRMMAHIDTAILANLVLGERAVPEYLQGDCTPERLAAAVIPLLSDTPERARQREAFARLDAIMDLGAAAPSLRAAQAVRDVIARHGKAAPSSLYKS